MKHIKPRLCARFFI